jgi:hypothetical protein
MVGPRFGRITKVGPRSLSPGLALGTAIAGRLAFAAWAK